MLPWGCWGATSVPATSEGATLSVAPAAAESGRASPPVNGAATPADVLEDEPVFRGTLGSCATRRRSCSTWLLRCKSAMTFTTSTNLIGLACAGTATNNSKLIIVAIGRKKQVFI